MSRPTKKVQSQERQPKKFDGATSNLFDLRNPSIISVDSKKKRGQIKGTVNIHQQLSTKNIIQKNTLPPTGLTNTRKHNFANNKR
jgi:hypothetical protein